MRRPLPKGPRQKRPACSIRAATMVKCGGGKGRHGGEAGRRRPYKKEAGSGLGRALESQPHPFTAPQLFLPPRLSSRQAKEPAKLRLPSKGCLTIRSVRWPSSGGAKSNERLGSPIEGGQSLRISSLLGRMPLTSKTTCSGLPSWSISSRPSARKRSWATATTMAS